MIDINGYDLTMYNYLKNKVDILYLTGRKDESVIRCPFCGDSVNNEYHAHCYVKNEPPFLFFCQRCEASGNGSDLLKQLNFYDPEMTQKLNQSYREYMKEMNLKYGSLSRNNKEYIILPNQYSKIEVDKINYFNFRLGVNMEESDVSKFRYILNLKDFFNNNDIDYTKIVTAKTDSDIEYLNDNYSMFLAGNSNDIICRYMHDIPKGDRSIKRYQRLTLYNTPNSSQKFYTIKNDLDIMKESHNLYLTEGIWDILGVYYLNGCKMNNNDLYIANNGKGYLNSLNYALKLGVTNANINVYSDADVSNENIRRFLKRNILAKYNGITVYRNNMYNNNKTYKDFGVPQDKIILSSPININII